MALPFRTPANASGQHQVYQGDSYGESGSGPLVWNKEDGSWLIYLGKPHSVALRAGDARYVLGAQATQLGARWVQVTATLPDEVSGLLAPGQWQEQLRVDMGTGGEDALVTLDDSTLVVLASAFAPGATSELITGIDVLPPLTVEDVGTRRRISLDPSGVTAGDYGAVSVTSKGIVSEIVPVAAAADLAAEVSRATATDAGNTAAIAAETMRAESREAEIAGDLAGAEASLLAQLQRLIPGALAVGTTEGVVNADGSITEDYGGGLTAVTTFPPDAVAQTEYSAPVELTQTLTIASDGSWRVVTA